MNKLFSIEGPVWSFFSKLSSAFLLSILWTVTSIPIFTIGASNAAIYYVMLKIFDEKDVKIVREYFKAFKENFKRATIIWVPLFLFILVGLADIYICLVVGEAAGYGGAVVFMCIEIVLVLFSIYVFPLIGRFENTFKQTVKNGLLMPIKHFFYIHMDNNSNIWCNSLRRCISANYNFSSRCNGICNILPYVLCI